MGSPPEIQETLSHMQDGIEKLLVMERMKKDHTLLQFFSRSDGDIMKKKSKSLQIRVWGHLES